MCDCKEASAIGRCMVLLCVLNQGNRQQDVLLHVQSSSSEDGEVQGMCSLSLACCYLQVPAFDVCMCDSLGCDVGVL